MNRINYLFFIQFFLLFFPNSFHIFIKKNIPGFLILSFLIYIQKHLTGFTG
jgi:hypothetical protein